MQIFLQPVAGKALSVIMPEQAKRDLAQPLGQ